MGEEFYPQALEQTIRYAASATKKPVYVTETALPTTDDSRRVAYIGQALDRLDGVSRMVWMCAATFTGRCWITLNGRPVTGQSLD